MWVDSAGKQHCARCFRVVLCTGREFFACRISLLLKVRLSLLSNLPQRHLVTWGSGVRSWISTVVRVSQPQAVRNGQTAQLEILLNLKL